MGAVTLFVAIVAAVAVIWAAGEDLLFRRISNRVVFIVLVAAFVNFFAGIKLDASLTGSNPETGLITAGAVLLVGFVLYLRKTVGAGDVKLTFALSLLLGDLAPLFLFVASLTGGLMVLGLPLLRMLETKLGVFALELASWSGYSMARTPVGLMNDERRNGLPYGPALAVGTLFVLIGSL